ncbi:MAG: hypothetical protein A2252_09465 [Elusimicrobia bacterium RIFOXYA2_FULL_39_19]|nr:MAG: hypothetical protein A2252_09465 [Elusimicrobia bacterium RIFOXYA2_FULL_39_19]
MKSEIVLKKEFIMPVNKLTIFVLCVLVLGSPAKKTAAAQQLIEVTVEIAEVNNNKAKELGIKWLDEFKTGELSQNNQSFSPALLPVLSNNNNLPALIRVDEWYRYSPLTADLKMLVEKGAAKILSKPKLLTKSGSEAKFLVGGEFPVVSGGATGGSIEWKEYGIKLKVRPTVDFENNIKTIIAAEVSRLDWINRVGSFPAIATRQVFSEVDIKSGETVTIAGLVETKKETKKIGIPLLMDIPFLGMLFGRHINNEVETTVMMFVTPKTIK